MQVRSKSLKTFVVIMAMLAMIAALLVPALRSTTVVGGTVEGAYNLDQAENGGVGKTPTDPVVWVNGALVKNKAHLEEGQSVAYRLIIDGLENQLLTTVGIEWDIRKSSKNAIDYITGPQRITEEVDPTDGVSGLGAVSYWLIPTPTAHSTRIDSFDALPDDHDNIYLWAYNVSSVSFGDYNNGSDTNADSSTSIDITFQPTSSTVVLAWGGHIASQEDWDLGNSASNINGSPYHMRVLYMINNDNITYGQQDMQLSAAAVVPTIPAYTIDKTVTDVDGRGATAHVTDAGDVISYQVTVTNTGDDTITGVDVSDPLMTMTRQADNPGNDDNNLEVDEIWVYTGSYTVQQLDIDSNATNEPDNVSAGFLDNTATVSCDQLDPQSDSAAVPIDQTPSFSIDKTVTDVDGRGATANVTDAGDMISYQVVVTNTGNLTLTGSLVDNLSGISAISGPTESGTVDGLLSPGETWTYTYTYTAQQEDIDNDGKNPTGNGYIDNTATFNPSIGSPQSDSASVPVGQTPSFSIDKTVTDVDGRGATAHVTDAGDVISYQVVVTNTGNQTLTGSLVENLSGISAISGPIESGTVDGLLSPGETWTYTYTYTAQQADIDNDGKNPTGNGYIDNTATFNPSIGSPQSDNAAVPIDQTPSFSIDKTVTDVDGRGATAHVTDAGDIISYQVVVTNTGNQTLTGSLVDNLSGISAISGPIESGTVDGLLSPGETWTYTYTYTAQQTDIDNDGKNPTGNGYIDNTATFDPNIGSPQSDSASVPIDQVPSFSISKTVTDVDGRGATAKVIDAGDVISYQVVVTNNGNIEMDGTLTDSLPGIYAMSGPTESIATDGVIEPGETWTYTYKYVATQSDINNKGINKYGVADGDGDIDNEAKFTPTVPEGLGPKYSSAAVEVPPIHIQSEADTEINLDICCTLPGNSVYLGDRLTLRIHETNTGDEPLSDVYVTVSPLGYKLVKGDAYYYGGDTKDDGVLDPGETWEWFIVGVQIQRNTLFVATGHGLYYPPEGPEEDITYPNYPNEQDSMYINVILKPPALSITKSGTWIDGDGDGYADVGEVIIYTFSVTNEGDVILTDVTVTDSKVTVVGGPTVLSVGETDTTTFSGTYTITQADIDAGYVANTATADSAESGRISVFETVELPTIIIQTTPDTTVTIATSAKTVNSGDTVNVTVTETNTGDDLIYDPYVWVGRLDPATGLVITPGWAMGKDDPHYVSGDTNNDGILDPGETWTWEILDVEITGDGVYIIAKGHGTDSSDNDVAWPEYPNERDSVYVKVI